MICFPIRTSVNGSTAERSTLRGPNGRAKNITRISRPKPPAAILTKIIRATRISPKTDDIFAELLRRRAREARHARGPDLHYHFSIEFLDAVNGATKVLTLPKGGTLHVTIPPGIQEGQILRLRGKGAPSLGEGEAGDALVEISINPHKFFSRQGDDIHLDLPITLTEAVLGAQIRAPTPRGPVVLTVPKGSNTGNVLRLKGRGVPRRDGHGDEFVTLKVMLPPEPNPELEAFLSNWTPGKSYDPRRDMQS